MLHSRFLNIYIGMLLCCLTTTAWAQTQRRVLLEVFSTERCNQCPQAHNNIQRIFGDGGDSIVMVGHHAGFYTDALTIPESQAYEWFYTPNRGLYAPAAMMNRLYDDSNTSETFTDGVPVFDGSSAKKLQSAYASAQATPLSVKVTLSTQYDAQTRELQVTVNSSLLRRLPNAADLRMNVVLTEDSIYSRTQSGAIGSYYHRHSARQYLTGTWGESIDLTQAVTCSYSTTIPADWNVQQMEVIAYVSSYDAQDRCGCQVYNTASVHLAEHLPEGIDPVHAEPSLPSPTYNLMGQRLCPTSAPGLRISQGRLIYK